MKVCKVIGNVQATEKHPCYEGKSIMLVQPVDPFTLKEKGSSFLSIDFVQSGTGEIVLVATEGNCARQLFNDNSVPVHSVITAIVDSIDKAAPNAV